MTEKSYQDNFWGSLNHRLALLFKIVKLLKSGHRRTSDLRVGH